MSLATHNAREVAEVLGITERTVRRWIQAGQLPAEKRGRAFQIHLDDARPLLHKSVGIRRAREQVRLAELSGQYRELQRRVADLERQLARERRQSGQLMERLRQLAA